jgi:hypothetical protein
MEEVDSALEEDRAAGRAVHGVLKKCLHALEEGQSPGQSRGHCVAIRTRRLAILLIMRHNGGALEHLVFASGIRLPPSRAAR